MNIILRKIRFSVFLLILQWISFSAFSMEESSQGEISLISNSSDEGRATELLLEAVLQKDDDANDALAPISCDAFQKGDESLDLAERSIVEKRSDKSAYPLNVAIEKAFVDNSWYTVMELARTEKLDPNPAQQELVWKNLLYFLVSGNERNTKLYEAVMSSLNPSKKQTVELLKELDLRYSGSPSYGEANRFLHAHLHLLSKLDEILISPEDFSLEPEAAHGPCENYSIHRRQKKGISDRLSRSSPSEVQASSSPVRSGTKKLVKEKSCSLQ